MELMVLSSLRGAAILAALASLAHYSTAQVSIQCPTLPELNFDIAYTMASDPNYPIGTIAIYICNNGTTLRDRDNVFRSCSSDGSWTGEEPICQATGCDDIPDPDNGNIEFLGEDTAPFNAGTRAVYSCDDGYNLVNDIERECVADGTDFIWIGDAPSCAGITCPSVQAPANGNVDYNEEPDPLGNYPFETIAAFSCSEGYGLEGDSSSTCIGDGSSLLGEFYPDPPSCQLITCPSLDNLQNGQVSYNVDSATLPHGTIVTYSCDPGHYLDGEAIRVCTGDGSSPNGYFNGTEPTCQEITCPVLDAPEYGSIEFSSGTEGPYDIGVVATYSCDEGFSLENGDEERTCQQDGGISETGMWSGMAPGCIGTCQSLSFIADGGISYSMEADENNEYLAGTVANYTCNDGFELFGDFIRMCQNNMSWTGTEPSCLISCPSLDEIEYGTIEFSSIPNAAGSYYRNTLASYSCEAGFKISGVDTLVCQEDMTWSGEAPTCERIMCPDLPDPLYGDIEYMNDTTAPFELEAKAVYTCNEGFVLIGEGNIRMCMSTSTGTTEGVWSGTAPSCEAITCPELLLPLNVAGIEYTDSGTPDYPYLTEADYTCEEGFELTSGDYVRICVMNGDNTTGVWSGQEPVCSPIIAKCPDIPNPVNGHIDFEGDSTSTFELGTVAKYVCDLGYTITEDNDTRTCEMDGFSAVGVWSGEAPYCVAVIECPLLEAPVNGSIVYSVGPEDGLGFGVTATYSCDVEGQGLSGGDTVRVCGPYYSYDYYKQLNLVGKWRGSAPTCELIRCPDIPDPLNGQIHFSNDRRAPFDYGTTAEYSCKAGYELSYGDRVRECTGNSHSAQGVWTGENLTCQVIPRSCGEINGTAVGTYELNTGSDVVNVTCNFNLQLPPSSPLMGWQEIANLNIRSGAHSCPSLFREVDRRCSKRRDRPGCESAFFLTNGVPFARICGQIIGYNQRTSDSFMAIRAMCGTGGCNTIDEPYLDGISITYIRNSRRSHIWSLAATGIQLVPSRCPCGGGPSGPSFVGDNYYCETGRGDNLQLWDGNGCANGHPSEGSCCSDPNRPWFCREFNIPQVADHIEVRLCRDQPRSDEDIEFDMLRLYTR